MFSRLFLYLTVFLAFVVSEIAPASAAITQIYSSPIGICALYADNSVKPGYLKNGTFYTRIFQLRKLRQSLKFYSSSPRFRKKVKRQISKLLSTIAIETVQCEDSNPKISDSPTPPTPTIVNTTIPGSPRLDVEDLFISTFEDTSIDIPIGHKEASLIVSTASKGTITIISNGVRYSPTSRFIGTDSFSYHLSYRGTHGDAARVTIQVKPQANSTKQYSPDQVQYAPNLLLKERPRLFNLEDVNHTIGILAPQSISSCNTMPPDADPYAWHAVCRMRNVVERISESNILLRPNGIPPDPAAPPKQWDFKVSPKVLCEMYSSQLYRFPNQTVRSISFDSQLAPIRGTDGSLISRVYTGEEFRDLLARIGIQSILEYSNQSIWAHWGNSLGEFLDEGSILEPVSMGYDCFFDRLTSDERATIRAAILRNAFQRLDTCYATGTNACWWWETNMNQAPNAIGRIIMAASAIYDDEPQIAQRMIERSIKNLKAILRSLAPDGGSLEGPGYHLMTLQGIINASEALTHTFGTDFGISGTTGLRDGALFPYAMTDPIGLLFDYSESSQNLDALSANPAYRSPSWDLGFALWAGKRFQDPIASRAEIALWPLNPWNEHLRYYSDNWRAVTDADLPLDFVYHSSEVVSFRSGTDRNASYVAAKGGNNLYHGPHIQLDAGTFVFTTLGERFVMDLGKESYSFPNNEHQYRRSSAGHNVLLVEDASQPNGVINQTIRTRFDPPVDRADIPHASINAVVSGANPSVSFDLRAAYDPNVNSQNTSDILSANPPLARTLSSYTRNFALSDNRKNLHIADAFTLSYPKAMTWRFHTTAAVTSLDANHFRLSLNGKNVLVSFSTPSTASLSVTNLEPIPNTGIPGAPNISECTARYVKGPLPDQKLRIEGTQSSLCALPTLPGTKRVDMRFVGQPGSNFVTVTFSPEP